MKSRIQALESASALSTSLFLSSQSDYLPSFSLRRGGDSNDDTPATIDGIAIPWRSLGAAVPISTGVPFFPHIAAIPPKLRSQILAGNDNNLVNILLCSDIQWIVELCQLC